MSAFKYYSLICKFYSKAAKNQIYKIHKPILRLMYEMGDASFEDLTIKSYIVNSPLLIEIYKSLNNISPPVMQDFYNLKFTSYNLRNKLKVVYWGIWFQFNMKILIILKN